MPSEEIDVAARDVPQTDHGRCGCPPCNAMRTAAQAPAPDWPVRVSVYRLVCSPDRPMPKGAKGMWVHLAATHDDIDSDYRDYKRCTACGHEWSEEIAQ